MVKGIHTQTLVKEALSKCAIISHHTRQNFYKTLMSCPRQTLLDPVLLVALSTSFSLLLSLLDTALMLCIFIEHALPFTWNMFAVPFTWNIFLRVAAWPT